MTKGPQALTVKPATALPENVYITVILRFPIAVNVLLIVWTFHCGHCGKSAACKKNTRL